MGSKTNTAQRFKGGGCLVCWFFWGVGCFFFKFSATRNKELYFLFITLGQKSACSHNPFPPSSPFPFNAPVFWWGFSCYFFWGGGGGWLVFFFKKKTSQHCATAYPFSK